MNTKKRNNFNSQNSKRQTSKNSYYLYGKHAVEAALKNPTRKILEILITEKNLESFRDIIGNKAFKVVTAQEINEVLRDGELHQGIAVKTASTEITDITQLNNISNVVILDQITDSHNIGAILRSAAAFNVDTMILPLDSSPSQNGIMAKVASGGMENVNMVKVVNIKNTIKFLKENGFWVVGLDGAAKTSGIPKNLIGEKLAVIMGSEGKGLRRLTLESCDVTVKIPMTNNVESLNVSNAAAIIFHQIYS